MKQTNNQLKKIFKIAVSIEEEGYNFYTKMREKAPPSLKKFFETLAKAEKFHIETFLKIAQEFKLSSREISEYQLEEDNPYDNLVFPLGMQWKEFEDKLTSPIEILLFAINCEYETIFFFKSEFWENNLLSAQQKKAVNKLIAEEEKHIQLLRERLFKST